MRTVFFMLFACVSLGGCAQAHAVILDPENDVHCSVLAFYFQGLAKHQGAPDKQARATEGLHDWYAARMRAATGARFADPAVLEREIGPVLDAVKAGPMSMRDELLACAERAKTDPAFNGFAKAYMR